MQHFVDATRAALDRQNWYAALTLALTMPDICGRLENPAQVSSQARFVGWYNRFLLTRYQGFPGGIAHTFLSGLDCYALRCAYLHQGEFGIEDQRARDALRRFIFTAPGPGVSGHMNQLNDVLQLQIDHFCIDVCEAVSEWLRAVETCADIQARIRNLAKIR